MNALIRFPWLLVAIPLLEIFILIKVGGHIGAVPTVALVIVTAVLGINLIRYQGMTTFSRVKGMVDNGQLPALELLEGLVLLVAGAFLVERRVNDLPDTFRNHEQPSCNTVRVPSRGTVQASTFQPFC